MSRIVSGVCAASLIAAGAYLVNVDSADHALHLEQGTVAVPHPDSQVARMLTATPVSWSRKAALPTINGYVGKDASITVSPAKVPAGWYRIVVSDVTSAHNWHISGRHVDVRTTVRGTGQWVWKKRLRRGTYSIVCDPHANWMFTSLRVTRS